MANSYFEKKFLQQNVLVIILHKAMTTNHILYVDCFKKYDPAAIQANTQFVNLSNYSAFINNKANEIFSIAANDVSVDSLQLQKEITELGIGYVKLFIAIRLGKIDM